MKSLSCLSLTAKPSPPDKDESMDPIPRLYHSNNEIDPYKDDTKTTVLGYKGPKMQTLIEVLRCELARPAKTRSDSAEYSELEPNRSWSPLHYSAFYNREAALSHFLRAGQSPDGSAECGASPLCVAVAAGHVEIVRVLCAAGATIDMRTREKGETALHIAIRCRQSEIIDLILSYGPALGTQTALQETVLHYAATKAGSIAPIITLLKLGADYEAKNSRGQSPAEVAIASSNIPAAVAIINCARGKRNKLVKEKEMLLKHVEKSQNRFSMNNDLIADIFEAGCDPDSTVLVEAIKKDDIGLAEMFLEKGADPNRRTATGLQPIFAALNCAGAQMVQLLVKHGADVTLRDADGLTVLQAALESPSAHDKEAISGIFDVLLVAGADPKTVYPDGRTMLHMVVGAELGLARVAQRLIHNGVKINERDRSGCTALHLAGQSRSCIEALLKNGAKAHLLNESGLTPLLYMLTSTSQDSEPDLEPIIKVSDLRKVDGDQKTALHIAAERGLGRSARLLLKHRAETTLIDNKNRTPLLLAVLNHQWAVVPLLATQPGINSWDEAGMTALHYVVTSIPKAPATWKDIASAAAKFCERGVSRSMRDRTGATPLIQAVKALPEEGLPVIEVLLTERGNGVVGRSNCIGHENHKQKGALHFAAVGEKAVFVRTLLKNGAPFALKDWVLGKGYIKPTSPANKEILKLIAEYDWMRRAAALHRISKTGSEEAVLPKVLPLKEMSDLLAMGLDLNALPMSPTSNATSSMLWAILNHSVAETMVPEEYLHAALMILLASQADANALTAHNSAIALPSTSTHQKARSPMTFLLETRPTIDIDVVTLFIAHRVKLSVPSPYYNGRHPLHSAVLANRIDIVDEFLTRRADANSLDANNRSPLHLAAQSGFWEIAENLLRCGAKADAQDKERNSVLHAAVEGESARIVARLLKAGARASVVNDKKMTPLASMKEDGEGKDRGKIVSMLKRAEEEDKKEDERLANLKKQQMDEPSRFRQPLAPTVTPFTVATSHPITGKPTPFPENPKKSAGTSQISGAVSSATVSKPIPQVAATKAPLNIQKPLPQPRVDSGFGHAKPLPPLDRTKQTLDGKSGAVEEKRNSSHDELAAWLAASKVLDRL